MGRVQTFPGIEPGEKEWRSAIDKQPVAGPVWLGRAGLQGDAQADRRNHGGPQQAVNVYPAEHYTYWRAQPGLAEMTGGAFGENFTLLAGCRRGSGREGFMKLEWPAKRKHAIQAV